MALPRADAHDQPASDETLGRAIAMNPAIQATVVMLLISFFGWGLGGRGVHPDFVLQSPVTDPWYSPLLATYAHVDTGHLTANALTTLLIGGLVALSASVIRFHIFFVVTGVSSSVAQVALTDAAGVTAGVIGASGAGFALIGYLLVANPVSLPVFKELNVRAIVLVIAAGGVMLTIWLSPEGSALLSHFTGLVLGMIAGRFRLLDPRGS